MEFVPVAETSGAIFQIGAFVLEGALAQRRRWLDAGLVDEDFSVAVLAPAIEL